MGLDSLDLLLIDLQCVAAPDGKIGKVIVRHIAADQGQNGGHRQGQDLDA